MMDKQTAVLYGGSAQWFEAIVEFTGEDGNRDGLADSSGRLFRAWYDLLSGYKEDPAVVMKSFVEEKKKPGPGEIIFHLDYDQIVLQRDVEFYSTCEHHFLPFFGKAHIAYIPKDRNLAGASKLIRILHIFARRLQIQERIGVQVVDCLMDLLKPHGAACIIEAVHLCIRCRGVENQNSTFVTSALRGVFREERIQPAQELVQLINMRKGFTLDN